MALTLKANGTGAANLIQAQWVNDFMNLFTGVMKDQPITFKPNVTLQAIANPPAAPTLALASGTNLGIGAYQYAITLVTADGGETLIGTAAPITTTSGNQAVNLSAIPTDSNGAATKRNIYRTKVAGSTFFKLATLNDNVTTTYSDTATDASLPSTTPPAHPSFGGCWFMKNANGTVVAAEYSDGSFSSDGGNLQSNGSGYLTTAGLTTNGHLNGGFPAAQTLTNNAALTLPAGPIATVTCASSVTGITIPNGTNAGDLLFVVNTAGTGVQVNFAGANIRDVGNVGVLAGHVCMFIWSGGTWYSRF